MSNSSDQPDHTPLVVVCITIVTLVFGILGAWLIIKGFQAGEILTTTAGTGLGGLCGLVGSKMLTRPNTVSTQTGDINASPTTQPTK
jgi:hypothetical protein